MFSASVLMGKSDASPDHLVLFVVVVVVVVDVLVGVDGVLAAAACVADTLNSDANVVVILKMKTIAFTLHIQVRVFCTTTYVSNDCCFCDIDCVLLLLFDLAGCCCDVLATAVCCGGVAAGRSHNIWSNSSLLLSLCASLLL